ncbi:MAG: PepSY-associated TM helix domain-containing protein, partial [Leptospirales bacterium]
MRSETIQKLHRWHAWSGLIFGGNLILFSFTGAILVFYAELNRAFGPQPPGALVQATAVAAAKSPGMYEDPIQTPGVAATPRPRIDESQWPPLQPVLTRILSDYPGSHPAHMRLAPARATQAEIHSDLDRYHRLDLDVPVSPVPDDAGESPREFEHINVYIDPASGMYARAEDRPDPLRWIFDLHATFFAGSIGKTLLGFVGLALLVSSVTGLIIYWPFSKGQSLRAPATLIRRPPAGEARGARRRLLFADWHKLVGILSLAFQILMAVTGLLLTFGTLVIQIYTYVVISELDQSAPTTRTAPGPASETQATEITTGVDVPGARPNPAAWVDLDRVYAAAREIHGDERYIKTILFPGEVQGPRHFGVLAYGTGVFGRYIPQLSMLRAARGQEAGADMIIELPWYIKLIAAAAPLHFGNFGGLPLKIAYCLFGLTSGTLS